MIKKLKFDEESLLAWDYLNLRYNDKVKSVLEKNADNEDLLNLKTFSDYFVLLNANGKREKHVLLVTVSNLYILSDLRKLELIQKIKLERIKEIVVFEFSSSLFNIKLENDVTFTIECYRRI